MHKGLTASVPRPETCLPDVIACSFLNSVPYFFHNAGGLEKVVLETVITLSNAYVISFLLFNLLV